MAILGNSRDFPDPNSQMCPNILLEGHMEEIWGLVLQTT